MVSDSSRNPAAEVHGVTRSFAILFEGQRPRVRAVTDPEFPSIGDALERALRE
jgi:hypothetical protein